MATEVKDNYSEVQERQLQQVFEAVKKREVKNFYFAACGGSLAALQEGDYIIAKELEIPTRAYTANEFVYDPPKALGENSVVIVRSHSGTTPETVRAVEEARKKGALTVAVSMDPKSPLCEAAEYTVQYTYGDELKDAYDGDNAMYARLIYGLLHTLNPNEKYPRILEALKNIQHLYDVNKEVFKEAAEEFGKKYKREDVIYLMASGAYYPQAYSFTSCLLMEMLWVHSNAIHTGEYFHGPFEVTDFDVPFLIIKSNGPTRLLDERAIAFAEKYSDKVEVVDTAEFKLEGVDEDLQEYVGPLVSGPVMRQYAQALSDYKGHPLSVRRYMWKMEY